MTLSALSKKIEKVENEISKYQKIISDRKKELAELKKQQHLLQVQEKQKMGENFISTLEEKLGTEVTDEMLKKFLAIANENAGESSKVFNENDDNNSESVNESTTENVTDSVTYNHQTY